MAEIIFYVFVLLFSVVIHEVSHGYAARSQGDDTAEKMGRLTLNPLAHLDPFGSIILPATLILLAKLTGGGTFLFGWAKPVPYNPLKLKDLRWGQFWVALAGPLANLSLAAAFALLIRMNLVGLANLNMLFSVIVWTNLMLAVFNLLPVPPLDGAKVLFGILGEKGRALESFLTVNSWLLLLLLLTMGASVIVTVVSWLFFVLTGSRL